MKTTVIPENRKQEMIDLRKQGVSLRKIASQYGISRQRVFQITGGSKPEYPSSLDPNAEPLVIICGKPQLIINRRLLPGPRTSAPIWLTVKPHPAQPGASNC